MKKRTVKLGPPLLVLFAASCSGQDINVGTVVTNKASNVNPTPTTTAADPSINGPGKAEVAPPVAKKEPLVLELFGKKLVDDYAWLRKKDSPEVLAHLRAENTYTEAKTAKLAPLRKSIYSELLGRLKETDEDVPYKDGAYLYYLRTEQGKQYPIFCRKTVKGGDKAPKKCCSISICSRRPKNSWESARSWSRTMENASPMHSIRRVFGNSCCISRTSRPAKNWSIAPSGLRRSFSRKMGNRFFIRKKTQSPNARIVFIGIT